jgi:glycosyltransferase involved in cell wall biosynthesis
VKTSKETIQILLAVKNGEEFLEQQLETLKNQVNVRIQLIVGLSQSNDSSRHVLEKYSNSFSGFRIIETDSGSPTGDFLHLLRNAKPNLPTAFCDQDDLWYPTKLKESLNELRKLTGPAAVTVGWECIDSKGELAGPSFIPHGSISIESLLFQNRYIGCSILLNELALTECQESLKFNSQDILAHDWWVLLLISNLGQVRGVSKSLMGYRIHASNNVGIPRILSSRWIQNRLNVSWAFDVEKQITAVKVYVATRGQAEHVNLMQASIDFLRGRPRGVFRIFFTPRFFRSNFFDEMLLRTAGFVRLGIYLVKRIWPYVK